MDFKVFGQCCDPIGQESYLNFCRPCVGIVSFEFFDDVGNVICVNGQRMLLRFARVRVRPEQLPGEPNGAMGSVPVLSTSIPSTQ